MKAKSLQIPQSRLERNDFHLMCPAGDWLTRDNTMISIRANPSEFGTSNLPF